MLSTGLSVAFVTLQNYFSVFTNDVHCSLSSAPMLCIDSTCTLRSSDTHCMSYCTCACAASPDSRQCPHWAFVRFCVIFLLLCKFLPFVLNFSTPQCIRSTSFRRHLHQKGTNLRPKVFFAVLQDCGDYLHKLSALNNPQGKVCCNRVRWSWRPKLEFGIPFQDSTSSVRSFLHKQ